MTPDHRPFAEIEVRHEPSRVVVAITGEVDLSNVSELRRSLEKELADGAEELVVDLSRLSFMDSLGLGALVAALRVARGHGVTMGIARPSRRATVILKLAGLDKVFPILDLDTAPHAATA